MSFNLSNIHEDWHSLLNMFYTEPLKTLGEDILPNISYQPRKEDIFRIFEKPIREIKIVIVGDEPSIFPNRSNGRAFGIKADQVISKSLMNIMKKIDEDEFHKDWQTLNHWEEQGVFLLNTALTVETGRPKSHMKYWENFIQRVISHISTVNPCIWMLWGQRAMKFYPYIQIPRINNVDDYDENTIQQIPINPDYNYIMQCYHPSIETLGNDKMYFLRCQHFLFANTILLKSRAKQINW